MVEDVDVECLMSNDCQDVSFNDARFKQSDICKIVHGDAIFDRGGDHKNVIFLNGLKIESEHSNLL